MNPIFSLWCIILFTCLWFDNCNKKGGEEGGSRIEKVSYTLGKGWRHQIAENPKILEEGLYAWVAFWQNDYIGAFDGFEREGKSDEVSVGKSRVGLALGKFFQIADTIYLRLALEAYEYRMSSGIYQGRYSPIMRGWARLRLGLKVGLEDLERQEDIDKQLIHRVISGFPEDDQGRYWQSSVKYGDGLCILRPLVGQVPPIYQEKIEGTQGLLKYYNLDIFDMASKAACLEVLDEIGERQGYFLFLRCSALICAKRYREASKVCKDAQGYDGNIPWFVIRFSEAETEDDLRLLSKAQALFSDGSGEGLIGMIRKETSMSAYIASYALIFDKNLVRSQAKRRIVELRDYLKEVSEHLTGQGRDEIRRMQVLERLGTSELSAWASVLIESDEKLYQLLDIIESLYVQTRQHFIDSRHSPEYLLILAKAYIDANRFSEALGILRPLEEVYPIITPIRELTEIISIQRTIDTKGAARRE